ncbi:ShlB/FhaC/HecB family hemolysin secretion/activation protein [Croceibacterium sp. LX-88]|uniref:ShlB/FhaC/HecB family hemolysin secretion/activation protein n=1 Tax=Croceibacterium selenioxidans TaxID=2838833 RepID=A0ABS5W6R9_9SPHN|nr:ShlB/FhaC/HecB family hemolysin secretion/activation protein [Croceibacterium selenioxidans]MBT2135013.1 ShlB/FhaC/HecB family hemolysin secretion/activation protein [Croceibacterium selenioxidans]
MGFFASRRLLIGLAMCVTVPGPALAQQGAVPNPPTSTDLDVARDDAGRQSPSTLSIEGDIERGPCPLGDASFANTRVTFSTVEFSGLPGVPASVLDAAWSDLSGRELPIAALCEVRDRAATILRNLGYLAAVQIPPQRIDANGTVRMDVLAAKLVEVQLRGEPGPSGKLIAAQLARLTEREWFNTREAERQLLLMEDMPGYTVRLVLRSAGGKPGEVVGDVLIERRAFELVAGMQNLGSIATGREAGFVALTANDLIGLGDRTIVSFYNTFDWNEQRIINLSHDLALNADGLRLGVGVLFGRTQPDLGGAPFNTDSFTAEAYLSYPFIRRQSQSLFGTAGFEVVDQEVNFGDIMLSDDQLRVAYARLDYQGVDRDSITGRNGFNGLEPRWRTAASLELRQGIDGLGASDSCVPLSNCLPPNVPISNFAADPSSFVARLDGQIEFRPAPRLTLAVAPRAQISDGPLLSYEQASLGNYTIGRGLEPGVALGDSALGASFELRYGSIYPRRSNGFAVEPFAFLDWAKAWIDEAIVGPDPRDVATAGFGARGRWGSVADFSVLLAFPLAPAGYQTETGDPRLLFTLTTRLLPWGDR